MNTESKLFKNSVVMPIPNRKVEIGLYFTEQKKLKRKKKEHFEEVCHDPEILDRIDEFVWLDFKTDQADAVFSFNLKERPYLARWWFDSLLYFELRKLIRIVRRGFTGGWQYWVENSSLRTKHKQVFRKFNIYVELTDENAAIEIIISYEGRSQVILKDIESLVSSYQLDTTLLKLVIFERECLPYKRLPESIRLQHHLVFPILGRDIARCLELKMPHTTDPYKLSTAITEIQMFFDHYIKHEKLRHWLGAIKDLESIREADIYELHDTSRDMCFGHQKVSSDIQQAIVNHGPYRLPEKKYFKAFFISTPAGKNAKLHIVRHMTAYEKYKPLQAYSHLPLVYEAALDFEIDDIRQIKDKLTSYIGQLELNPEVQYMAFYISPYPKYGIQGIENEYYYWVKEILLKRNIASQVIDQAKVKGAVDFWIPNISIAMVAKMGGIPWKLARQTDDELIVGFGAFKSPNRETPYIGSSFCFDNEGRFQEFNCWSDAKEWALIGQLYKAIQEYRQKNGTIKRLVIHYYKELNKKEFRQVENLLDRFDSKISIIVVRIKSTFQHKELVMDKAHPKYLPVNGSYYHLKYQDYLLYINERRKGRSAYVKSARYPLKVSLQSNKPGLFSEDKDLVARIMQQLYDFSLLHWRSINQPRLPVTIAYPEYLARIFPHFDAETLQETGRTRLWFI